MKRKGMTFSEILRIIAVIACISAILIPLAAPFFSVSTFYEKHDSFYGFVKGKRDVVVMGQSGQRFQVIKGTSKNDSVYLIDNYNDGHIPKYNSETIDANIDIGKWYLFEIIGYQDDKNGIYPNVFRISKGKS